VKDWIEVRPRDALPALHDLNERIEAAPSNANLCVGECRWGVRLGYGLEKDDRPREIAFDLPSADQRAIQGCGVDGERRDGSWERANASGQATHQQ